MSRHGYSLLGYAAMMTDRSRMEAYQQALSRSITPGCTVVDIGTGIGATAILARRLGAAHVTAIEPADAITLGPQLERANNDIGGITWIRDISANVAIDAPADVLVSDLRGVLPLYGEHIPALIDARTRLLKQGGVLIPARDVMKVSLVSSARPYEAYQERWDTTWLGIDLSPARTQALSEWKKVQLEADDLLVSPRTWAEINYSLVTSPDVRGAIEWEIERSGTAYGIVVWFDTELVAGVGFSNAPGQPELLYGQGFFPLQNPLRLLTGDRVQLDLRASLKGGEYIWIWCVNVEDGRTGARRESLRQSTIGALRRIDERRTVRLSAEGRTTRTILDRLSGGESVGAVADWLSSAEFSGNIDRASAVRLVDRIAQQYGVV